MILSVTGHRPDKLGSYKIPNPIYNYITSELRSVLLELKPEKVLTGMALGFDQYVAEMCVELSIPFVACVPFAGQERVWPQASKDKYNDLLKKACEVVVVSEGGYSPKKMQIRNEYMTNRCDCLVACYNGDLSGGTYNCIKHAESIGKKIIVIDPRKAVE